MKNKILIFGGKGVTVYANSRYSKGNFPSDDNSSMTRNNQLSKSEIHFADLIPCNRCKSKILFVL